MKIINCLEKKLKKIIFLKYQKKFIIVMKHYIINYIGNFNYYSLRLFYLLLCSLKIS